MAATRHLGLLVISALLLWSCADGVASSSAEEDRRTDDSDRDTPGVDIGDVATDSARDAGVEADIPVPSDANPASDADEARDADIRDTSETLDAPADAVDTTEDVADAAEPCPDDVVCIDTFPYQHRASTLGAERRFDAYGCAPGTNESGPEVTYRVALMETGFLAMEIGDMAPGVDIDVHLLSSLDSDDCIDRGHWRAGGYLDAGTYWVVADTWVNGTGVELAGAYTLRMHLTTTSTLEAHGIDPDPAGDALNAFAVAWEREDTTRFEYTITDFSLHSSQRRQWIVDLATDELLWNLHVSHGEASVAPGEDTAYASIFSNVPESHQSSLGVILTAEEYDGNYGRSCRLDGLETYNDNVRSRAIVLHPWAGSRPEYVEQYGETALSWGCPAIDDQVAPDVVERTSGGTLMFFWYPDGHWSEHSLYLQRP